MSNDKAADVMSLTKGNSIKIFNSPDQRDVGEKLPMKVYKRRWLMLGLFVLFAASSVYQWIQYSIIANIVTRYWHRLGLFTLARIYL